MSKYFDRFPIVEYNGKVAKNLLTKVDFTKKTQTDVYANFDTVLVDGQSRSDIVSYNAYESVNYDWLIYLQNNIIDPYHDYLMSPKDFNAHIIKKYGSVAAAKRQILYYRNHWSRDDSILPIAKFDAMHEDLKKYWDPVNDNDGYLNGYKRKTEDHIVSTNMIQELTLADPSGYAIGQIFTQSNSGAQGHIISVDYNIITVQHVKYAFEVDAEVLALNLIKRVIPAVESIYWSSVSAYDKEEEENEMRKQINLIKQSYLADVDRLFVEQIKKK